MLLRHHRLMSYLGFRNWPPVWCRIRGAGDKHPKGEIGILRSVKFSSALPINRCFLNICYQDSEYMGCLLFDNHIFCREIAKLLQACCGTALKTGERVVVEDVMTSPIFLGTAALEVMLDAGALAVQSTPLVSPGGHRLGVLSTHYRKPHRPHARELDVLDRLAYQTIKCIGLKLQPGQVFVSS